jgi:MYXO-CTERM domain-containing protein
MNLVQTLGAAAVILTAGSAQAGLISANFSGDAITPLSLTGDGTFNGGYGPRDPLNLTPQDWGYVTVANGAPVDRTWVDEDWVAGGSVAFTSTMTVGEDATQFIGLSKRAKNRSGFDWTAFDIEITTPGAGIVTVDESTLFSPDYSSVTVLNNGTNVVTLKFTGGSVGFNQFADFIIDFEIPAGPSWTYTMTQTAIPTPGALGLLGLGGMIAGRRRR